MEVGTGVRALTAIQKKTADPSVKLLSLEDEQVPYPFG
jgi:hypothetical protein